jgi:glutamate-ammonia-ligase adenylyltransferase
MDLLSSRTEDGTTFATDARLRPDGEKGLLVNTLGAYREYYKKRAMLWEIQSLSRFRPIAGNPAVIQEFSCFARNLTDFSKSSPRVAAFNPNWKAEIHRMRMRIEKERTPAGQDKLAIKTGRGGLMDVEFVAQALCLENGWHEPNTLSAIRRAGSGRALPEPSAALLTEHYKKLMQVERILRRWSFEPESVLPTEPAPYYRVAVRCGYQRPEDFEKAVSELRAVIRTEYSRFFENHLLGKNSLVA